MRLPSISGWLVILSLVLLVYGVAASVAPLNPLVHVVVVVTAVLVFYAAIAAAYLGSAASGDKLVYALGVAHAISYLVVAFGLLGWGLVLGSVIGIAASLLAALRARGAGRYAALSLTPVYVLGAATGLRLLTVNTVDPITAGLWALYAVPGAAVAPVNTFALAKTYGVAPSLLPVILSTSYAILYLSAGSVGAALFTLTYGVLTTVLVARSTRSSVYRRAAGIARKSHTYMLWGEALVSLVSVLHGLVVYTGGGLLLEAHSLAMGYIASHVFIHAPLMVPPVLRAPAARRYTPLPYLLLVASLIARLVNLGHVAFVLFIASIAALVYTAVDLRGWLIASRSR